MDILIIAQYLGDLSNPTNSNNRFLYLYQMLNKDNDVEIVTSDFMHMTKRHINASELEHSKINITFLHESGYPKNICLKRFSSHKELARNLKLYLSKRKKPDIIYCAVPSLDVAYVASEYCKKMNVKNIIDVQDLWPDAFKMVFHIPILSDLIFSPMKKKADKIYCQADQIIAVSKTYAMRTMQHKNKCKCKDPIVVYLGTDRETFDKYSCSINFCEEKIRIVYIGALNDSHDIKCVIEAIKKTGRDDLQLVVVGDGELKDEHERYAVDNCVNAIFTGQLDYPHTIEVLMQCQIAVNLIGKNFTGNIINNVSDYTLTGLPIVNIQESTEYQVLLEEYNVGINCQYGDSTSIAQAIIKLADSQYLQDIMSENSKQLGKKMLDGNAIYHETIYKILVEKDIIYLAYSGTLGSSYDLPVVFKALRTLNDDYLQRVIFIVMGDGPKRVKFENIAKGLPVIFTGMLPYNEMVWVLSHCDIAVNPIVPNAAQSIINKQMDYAMAGLPVINTQESTEYRNLLNEYKAGINCECGSEIGVAQALLKLIDDKELRKSMGKNNRKLGEEMFDRESAYSNLIKQIKK